MRRSLALLALVVPAICVVPATATTGATGFTPKVLGAHGKARGRTSGSRRPALTLPDKSTATSVIKLKRRS